MSNKKIRIAVSGAVGRIGSILIQKIQKNKNIQLTIAISKHIHNVIQNKKKYINELQNKKTQYIHHFKPINENFDVLIDFTHPTNTLEYIKYCLEYNKKIVIGTTGFTNQEKKIIQQASKKIGIVFSSNFSIGMNTMYKLIHETTKNIGNNSDIAIIETHHNKKIDKPSGTAISLKEIISNTLLSQKQETTTKKKIIDIASLRLGDTNGDHTVIYSSLGERIEITHRANNRSIFATGAIQAAIWLNTQQPGLFNMQHVLNLI